MPKLAMNKASLHKERKELNLYQKVLPSLDLKRKQLLSEFAKTKKELHTLEQTKEDYDQKSAALYPMAASQHFLPMLPEVQTLQIGEENLLGVKLPTLQKISFKPLSYPLLFTPPWTEFYIARIEHAVKMGIEHAVTRQRITLLEHAIKKVTQRINLFEKVLIPQKRSNLRKLSLMIEEAQRAGVIRSKIAKSKFASKGH